MRELEERAKAELDAALLEAVKSDPLGVASVIAPKELVALGIVDKASGAASDLEDMGDVGVTWFELENSAEHPSADGRGEFFVEGEDIMRVLERASVQLGDAQLGGSFRQPIDALLRERVVILWHTHVATTDPSQADIEEFPVWLADYGMVFHVPSQTTTVYNQSGVISSSSTLDVSSVRVQDVGP